jgi:hypothetical protein
VGFDFFRKYRSASVQEREITKPHHFIRYMRIWTLCSTYTYIHTYIHTYVPFTGSEKYKRFAIILGIIVADNMQKITTMLERHSLTTVANRSSCLYSLRSILLFINTNVFITKMCLDTSVLTKSIMGRRE